MKPPNPSPADPAEPRAAARDAGLRYASDASPGLTRRRSGRGFSYRDPDGVAVRDPETLARIKALAIPPAWTDVWICRWPNGHLQASGRDARGRKQYRYHDRWHERRGTDKFDRMLAFAEALPGIRARCDEDLARRGLPREKVLAAVVRLLELTLIRVGNDEYARLNQSFGLTTLRDRHASVDGTAIQFRFRGKSGQTHEVGLRDRRLASLVRRCQELPGQELFQYVDEDGDVQDVASDDVNAYLREASGGDFTAKDFRTWAGTVLAYRALRALAARGRANGPPERRRGDPPDSGCARQHACGGSAQLCPSGSPGGLPRRRHRRCPCRGGGGAVGTRRPRRHPRRKPRWWPCSVNGSRRTRQGAVVVGLGGRRRARTEAPGRARDAAKPPTARSGASR